MAAATFGFSSKVWVTNACPWEFDTNVECKSIMTLSFRLIKNKHYPDLV
jgi:hypothetical protein